MWGNFLRLLDRYVVLGYTVFQIIYCFFPGKTYQWVQNNNGKILHIFWTIDQRKRWTLHQWYRGEQVNFFIFYHPAYFIQFAFALGIPVVESINSFYSKYLNFIRTPSLFLEFFLRLVKWHCLNSFLEVILWPFDFKRLGPNAQFFTTIFRFQILDSRVKYKVSHPF